MLPHSSTLTSSATRSRNGRSLMQRPLASLPTSAFTQFLVLMEGVFAWVAGGAATQALYANSAQKDCPDIVVVLQDGVLAVVLTTLALIWFVVRGCPSPASFTGLSRHRLLPPQASLFTGFSLDSPRDFPFILAGHGRAAGD